MTVSHECVPIIAGVAALIIAGVFYAILDYTQRKNRNKP